MSKNNAHYRNLRGTWVDGSDPDPKMLERIYENIKDDEIVIFRKGDPQKKGWLKFKAGNYKSRKYFHLDDLELKYFKKPPPSSKGKPDGIIELTHVKVLPTLSHNKSKFYIAPETKNAKIRMLRYKHSHVFLII